MKESADMKRKLSTLNRPLSVTVTSGKGGVGKSVLSLSLCVKLASDGIRTLLVDADLGLGNQHLLFGQSPIFTFEDVLASTCGLDKAVVRITEHLSLLPARSGYSDNEWDIDLSASQVRLMLTWVKDRFDIILIDTGAGISPKVMTPTKLTDIVLIVTTPEIAAVADSYALAKYLLNSDSSARIGFVINRSETECEGKRTTENLRQMAE